MNDKERYIMFSTNEKLKVKIAILLLLSFTCFANADKAITVDSLMQEMINLDRLFEFPAPYYKTIQYSSYDRSTKKTNGPDWFNNADGFGRESIPAFEAVLKTPDDQGIGKYLVCDVQGPGAIVRTWTAKISGTIKMFLDGSEIPVFNGSAQDFFKTPYKVFASDITPSLFEGTFTQRDASYLPIPFAQHCRIEWTGNLKETHFYHIQIRRYEPGTKVATFSQEQLHQAEPSIRQVAAVLREPDSQCAPSENTNKVKNSIQIKPKAKELALEVQGSQVIKQLMIKLQADNRFDALRQTVMTINFDDYTVAQVQSPVGDFFGAGPGVNPYTSLPFTVKPNGTMECRYPMPFAGNAKIYLHNLGTQEVNAELEVIVSEQDFNNHTLFFNALWRVDHDLITSNPQMDIPFLIARGSGRWVGTAVMLLNPCNIPRAGGGWWGEGDEKIFVDDDVFPSTFGTGSEDYFNYSWSSNGIFTYPYCAQSRNDGPANRGFIVNSRFHILDDLPFKNFLAFYMELMHHTRNEGFSYGRISYFYSSPGTITDQCQITRDDVRKPRLPEFWLPVDQGGAKGYRFYQVEELLSSIDDQRLSLDFNPLWASGELLIFDPVKKGDMLNIPISISDDGNYSLMITNAQMPGLGFYSATLDGKELLQNIQLNQDHRVMSRSFGASSIELKKGAHQLTIVSESDSDEDKIGLDFIWIKKE